MFVLYVRAAVREKQPLGRWPWPSVLYLVFLFMIITVLFAVIDFSPYGRRPKGLC